MSTNKPKGKRYKCPYCEYRGYRVELIDHVEDDHEDMIPKDYTPARVVYNAINRKEHGSCMICHKETKWDENKQRYDTLCGSKKCKDEYVKIVRSRMVKKYGTHNLLTDPNFQKKMLENRSISGKYKFEDGGSVGYVGSYEKKFLEFMDKFLHIKSYDIISPGPTIPYTYKGKEHTWITDFIYEPYDLVFDIKDGGDNPNTRDMKEYREKQTAKEKAIAEYGDYNYIRLTDNKFEQLISIFMELKEKADDKPLIRINESFLMENNKEDFIDNIGAYHLEPKIGNKGPNPRGWDEELYSKEIRYGILNDIKSNYNVKDQTTVKAYVYTAGKNLKPIYLGIILIPDKNNIEVWEWEKKETLSDEDYNYLIQNPMESCLLSEGTKSSLDSDYKPKGKKNLSSFKRVHITEAVINKYKKEYPFLKHVRCKDTKEYICDGYIWFDNNELVAMVGSCEYTDDKTKWIVSLEITKDYKGYGLSKQILDYATKTMNCKYLSVNKNNEIAKKVYDNYGFKAYEESDTMYYMTIDNGIKESFINENYLISQDDIKFNFDLWKKKSDHNILFVTGLSGSGKSTLARKIAKEHKAEYVEFDMFTLVLVKGLDSWNSKVNDGSIEVHPLILEYVSQTKFTQPATNSWAKLSDNYNINEHNKFVKWFINRVSGDGKLYVLEGAQFFMNMSEESNLLIAGEPLIVTGTSMMKSWFRRYGRDVGEDKNLKTYMKYLKKDIPALFKYYFENEKNLQDFVSNMSQYYNECTNDIFLDVDII